MQTRQSNMIKPMVAKITPRLCEKTLLVGAPCERQIQAGITIAPLLQVFLLVPGFGGHAMSRRQFAHGRVQVGTNIVFLSAVRRSLVCRQLEFFSISMQ